MFEAEKITTYEDFKLIMENYMPDGSDNFIKLMFAVYKSAWDEIDDLI